MIRLSRIRASAVCVAERAGVPSLLCVRMRDPKTRIANLFVPGGGIESDEDAPSAAAREALEETGYCVEVEAGSEVVAQYPFEWDGILIDVTTHFFRARLAADGPEPPPEGVQDASYNEGAVWLPLTDVERVLGFHAVILAAVRQLIRE